MRDLTEGKLNSGMVFSSWTDDEDLIFVQIGMITVAFEDEIDFLSFVRLLNSSAAELVESSRVQL